MNTKISDEILLKQLAVIFSKNPQYTLKELAEAAGISKASLYRICGTRENLEKLLVDKSRECIELIFQAVQKPCTDYPARLLELIRIHLENKEFLTFAYSMQVCQKYGYTERYLLTMDAFLLSGQKAGIFKIEFDAATLTELFISVFLGIIDAERRGRIAPAIAAQVFLKFYLGGAGEQ